jgi:hypothetical protein
MFEDSLPTFEALLALAKEDPVEFEALRDQLCKQIVDQAPEHISRRLKGLQFKINMERRRSKTALKSCLELSKLMNNSLIELDEALSNPQEFLMKHNSIAPQAENTNQTNQTNTQKSSAEIIQLFPKPSVISETPTIVTPTTSED